MADSKVVLKKEFAPQIMFEAIIMIAIVVDLILLVLAVVSEIRK